MRSNHNTLGDAVSHVHQVNISDSILPRQRKSSAQADGKQLELKHSSVMAFTKIRTMHEAEGMLDLTGVPKASALQVGLHPPAGGLWRGQCQRLLFVFESSSGAADDVYLVPFLGAAMHAFVAQYPVNGAWAKDLIHAHGIPMSSEESLSLQVEKAGADMCSMDVHSTDRSQTSVEGSVIMYVRFAEAGPYAIFVQVYLLSQGQCWTQSRLAHFRIRCGDHCHIGAQQVMLLQVAMGDDVHVARINVVVQDVLLDMTPLQPAVSDRGGVVLSFSAVQPDDEVKKLSVDQYVRPGRDSPCMTIINSALTWFGSICLSACKPAESEKTLKCPIPFPAHGAPAQANTDCKLVLGVQANLLRPPK